MSSKQINIFLTGATGYIGGSILTGLLNHPNASNFKITALIRGDESRVKKLESLGVTPVVGSNDSHDIIEKAASQSDVVIHTADSADDLPSAKSIVSGLNKRTQTTGKQVIYIHTSGTGVLAEDVRGKRGSNTVYNDLDPDQINGLAEIQIHRNVDLFIINAAQVNPLLKSVIVLPSVIYGTGTGLFKRQTIVFVKLIQIALQQGKLGLIGPGEATWDNVHIDDLVDAYIILFNELLAAYGPDAKPDVKPNPYLTTGREGYYFVENGRNTWREIFEKVSEILHKKGYIQSSKVTSIPDDEINTVFPEPFRWFLGTQSNATAQRLRKLGWKPYRPSVLDAIEQEVDATISENKN
ncbi:unnamed protein product [Rotaria sordida]|uniref:NmrA-like domain-containing protein n=1 Tax=Rotaria sordida TaxID=392033 RepID=A0A819MMR9_9BILA|nr:unnamed protein product [Rotaria sordida]CAF3982458.1 unnamed protein product [Rotaria sordida]